MSRYFIVLEDNNKEIKHNLTSKILLYYICYLLHLPLKKKKFSFLGRSFCFQNPIVPDEIKEKEDKTRISDPRARRTSSSPGISPGLGEPSGCNGTPHCRRAHSISGIGLGTHCAEFSSPIGTSTSSPGTSPGTVGLAWDCGTSPGIPLLFSATPE